MNISQINQGINSIRNKQSNIGFQAGYKQKLDLGEEIRGIVQDTARFVQKRALPIGMATTATLAGIGGYVAYRTGLIPEVITQQGTSIALKADSQIKSPSIVAPLLIGAAGGRHIPIEEAKPEDLVSTSAVRIPARRDIFIHEDSVKPLQEMIKAAHNEGVDLVVVSGNRDPIIQKEIFQSKGQTCKVRSVSSALPGTSTHQYNGIDLGITNKPGTDVENTFNGTPEAEWIRNNAPRYGFVLPYSGNTPFNQAGVAQEDWHVNHIQTLQERKVLEPVIAVLDGKAELADIGCDSNAIYTPKNRTVQQSNS